MHPLPSAALCLALLASVAAAQDARPRPRGPIPGSPRKAPKQRIEPLVKLPDDFVRAARVPGGGRFPRLAVGGDTLAVLAVAGEGEETALVLACSRDEGATFTEPARLAPGGIRTVDGLHTGSLDVGPDGRIHVAWIAGGEPGVLCYASASPEGVPGATVELGSPPGLCSTAAVAVDAGGRVHLFYAADREAGTSDALASDAAPGMTPAPPGRRIWMRRSADGATFDAPVAIDKPHHDVSGASALAAHVDAELGTLFVLYRSATVLRPDTEARARDVRLLASSDQGASFEPAQVENWKLPRDPGSAVSLVQDPGTTLAVWESRGTVLWTPLKRHEKKPQLPTEVKPDPEVLRSRPAAAAGEGEVLLAWLERPRDAPDAPAQIAWRVWQRDQRIPLGDGVVAGSEGAGAPAVFARKGGGFTILH